MKVGKDNGKLKYRTDGREGVIGYMLKGGMFTVVTFLLGFYTFLHACRAGHDFYVYWCVEARDVEEATERYQYSCVDQNAKQARLFFKSCREDSVIMNKYPAWEALDRVMRGYQLCGEKGDCGIAIYIVFGIVIGVIGIFFLLNKMHGLYLKKLEDINRPSMHGCSNSGNTDWNASWCSGIAGGDDWRSLANKDDKSL